MLRRYEVIADWHPATEYSFEVDSAAFADIYGLVSGEFKQGIKVRNMDEYSTLLIQLSGVPDSGSVVVQLVATGDKVVKSVKADADRTAQFFYVTPGTYYLRAFIDRNDNGVWDTGSFDDDEQAEQVYYNPQSIEAKAKWDLTHRWNLTAVPLNRQKPAALVKQKAEEKKVQNRNADRASQLGIEYKGAK